MKYVSYLWEALQGRLLQQLACCLLLLIPAAALAAPPEVIWRTHTGARSDNGAVLLGEQLYVAGAAQTAVLDPAAGTILRFLLPPDPTAISSPPISTDTGVVAGDVAGRLIAWEDGAPPAVLASLRRSLPVTALRAAGGDRIVVAS